MALRLTIENETSLPDGGPLSVVVSGKRGLDIGRDSHLDWTLPDPSRAISGKHCEVRYQDGGYVLYDVSTNGTFLDGAAGRLKGPHRLRNGDKLVIGHYIIAVAIDGEAAPSIESRVVKPAAYEDLWNSDGDAAPPVDRSQVRAPAERPKPVRADFLDWAADVPEASPGLTQEPISPRRRATSDDMDWARATPRAEPAPPPEAPMPSPRRPVWVSNEPDGPWNSSAAEPPPPPAPAEAVPAPAPRPVEADSSFAPPSYAAGGASDFAREVARGAGLPEDFFAAKRGDELARELGAVTRIVAENVRQLLIARSQAKRHARSANQTMVQATENNPLKFAPTAEEALRIMFGPPTRSYLDAPRALQQGFDDLKSHQIRTYKAMQQALAMLIEDFDPKGIDLATGSGLLSSRKSRMWDLYTERWKEKASGFDGGLLDAFMSYFAECYDREDDKR